MQFLVASLIVVLMPGTGAIYTISTGMAQSWRAGIAAAVGCTFDIVPHLLASILGLSATQQLVGLSAYAIAPCRACESCRETGVCAIDDDMGQIYEDFRDCDALIIGTPVYFRNVSAQLKAVFDRAYAVRPTKPLAGRFGGAIAVGRGTGGGQSIALTVIHNFFLSMGVICVPGELNGVSAVADKPGDILRDERRLRQARVLGENILHVAEKARA
jgi:multimeric flavodoxin WrbA